MAGIESFQISISEDELLSLKRRLELTRFPDELDQAAWDLGSPLADIKRLAIRWRDGFDWREAEARINKLPQYRTSVQVNGFEPLQMHFVHHVSPVKKAIPLLFCHGCEYSLHYAPNSQC